MNPIETIAPSEIRKAALQKYNSYGSEWEKAYFDKFSGGYIVIDKQRIEQGNINKQEKEKYDREFNMCQILAKNGYKVEYLKLTEGSFDIKLNGISADLKKTASHNNILDYAKKAVYKQGAKLVIFEFEKETAHIKEELKKLKEKGISIKYYFSNNTNKIKDL